MHWSNEFGLLFISSQNFFFLQNNIQIQLTVNVSGGKIIDAALYDSLKDKLNFDCKFCNKILWKNGQVPIAQRILRTTLGNCQ